MTPFLREALEHRQPREIFLAEEVIVPGGEREARARWDRFPLAILSGQKPRRQRMIGNDSNIVAPAKRHQVLFDLPFREIIWGLDGHKRIKAERPCRPQRLTKLPSAEARAADVAHFSL